ncbi:lmbB1 [Streptomyces lincolnensis]|uniref:LmbB1 n=2 Tax=Streptomyces lincolnensis TaxID=1915 RepID=Q54354_STRLN|nr:VOC family protein [Streptomyces lincolnensis]ABX00598.1 LmbB1 [Streptomyces lincolnensis]AXG51383.1 lmbB1 [Streptomyces lincolnensis]QMV04447.1 VOC family protein [Streptomyces lincolnensis]QMV11877.1 VOC family protein [Streptomyces lincolnensis]CAA55747.1 lmbB1 [Streptomyces lincolnensis]
MPSVKSMPPVSVHHVGVQTADLDNSISWYQEFFGCTVSWTLDTFSALTHSRLPGIERLAELRYGDVRFHHIGVKSGAAERSPAEANQFQHVCFAVGSPTELEAWRSRWLELYARGRWTFAVPERATDIDVDKDGVRSFYALDPNGLEYEFTYVPDGPR